MILAAQNGGEVERWRKGQNRWVWDIPVVTCSGLSSSGLKAKLFLVDPGGFLDRRQG